VVQNLDVWQRSANSLELIFGRPIRPKANAANRLDFTNRLNHAFVHSRREREVDSDHRDKPVFAQEGDQTSGPPFRWRRRRLPGTTALQRVLQLVIVYDDHSSCFPPTEQLNQAPLFPHAIRNHPKHNQADGQEYK
jgi:hypothetical protein